MPKINEPTTKVGKALKGVKVPKKRTGPLWLGPQDSSHMGGVTQSMLNSFLCCRERFRLKTIEGLQPTQRFHASMDFGQLWHCAEEHHSRGTDYEVPLRDLAKEYCVKFPLQQDEINKWYNVCKTLFPIYVEYWKKDLEQKQKTPLLQEYAFNVPYELPSGRIVHLRGKFDAVDLIKKEVVLQENKTKSEIDEEKIRRTLMFDLQTMLYLIALTELTKNDNPLLCGIYGKKVTGLRYNVIRRPLAGGKGSIRPHAATAKKPAESSLEFYQRLHGVIMEDVDTYFLRIKSEVYPSDIERFKKLCLNPLLEQLCDWYSYVSHPNFVIEETNTHVHYMSPFGLWNPIVESGQTDLDEYLETGSEVGLHRVETLFTELQ